jgi:cellulose biosynthesis protein BcsQ
MLFCAPDGVINPRVTEVFMEGKEAAAKMTSGTKIIGVINRKGGAGRTTTSCALSISIALRFGLRVGVLDGDKEGFATVLALGHRCVANPLTAPPVSIEHPRLTNGPGLLLYRAGAALETASDTSVGNHILRAAADVDVLFIDTPGDRSSPVVGATLALADVILSPVMSDFATLAGFEKTRVSVSEMKSPAQVLVVRSRWERTRIGGDVSGILVAEHRPALLDTVVRKDQRVADTTGTALPVPLFAPRCRAARDYDTLACELASLWGWVHSTARPSFQPAQP